MGRATHGVRGIRLRPRDRVVGAAILEAEGEVLSVAARGFGKRTPIADYRKQSRGGLGIINLKVSDKTGEVIAAKHVTAGEGLILITQGGMIIRLNVADVRLVGRSTQGVKLMDLDPEDLLVAVAKLAEPAPADPGPSEPDGFPPGLAPDVVDEIEALAEGTAGAPDEGMAGDEGDEGGVQREDHEDETVN